MLTKEQKQQAQKMREDLAPVFKKAANLAKVWQEKAKAERIADNIARIWQYRGQDLRYCDNLTEEQKQEEAKQAAQTYEQDHRGWHEELEKRYISQSNAEERERAAYFNYLNYLYYICELVADQLRPYAWNIYQTRGDTFKEWAEIINPERETKYNPVYLSFYISSVFNDSICLNIEAWNSWGSPSAKTYYYYKKVAQEPTKTPKEPQTMTATQFAKRKKILLSYIEKAEQLRNEQIKKAKEWGMLDAVKIIKYIDTEKYR